LPSLVVTLSNPEGFTRGACINIAEVSNSAQTTRSRPDACPGALQVHQAADGALARIRVPGGLLTGRLLGVLAEAADTLGSGGLHLTSRANLQIRGVRDPGALAALLSANGLLPSPAHERVRNIVASPLPDGPVDVHALVAQLDSGLRARAGLAALPGRFLFGLDDGRGDVLPLKADVTALGCADGRLALVLAGFDTGLRVPVEEAAGVMLRAAEVFLGVRGDAWRVAEAGPERVAAGLGLTLGPALTGEAAAPLGVIGQRDGSVALGFAVPLGRLSAGQAALLSAAERLVVTPWRGVVVPGLTPERAEDLARALRAAGLVDDPASPWAGVTACAGRPGCAKALADVRADAADALVPGTTRVHWSGCGRRCGLPPGEVIDVVATGTGYDVNGRGHTGLGETAAALAAARRST
jgi:precorrin-3B synthase